MTSRALRRLLPEGTRRGALARAANTGLSAFRLTFRAQSQVPRAQSAADSFRPTFLWRLRFRLLSGAALGKRPGRQDAFRPFRMAMSTGPHDSPLTFEVLIPVYNRIDQLRLLVEDILRERRNGNIPGNVAFHLLDDASGQRSAKALEPMARELDARLTRRDRNVGFLTNVNLAYESSTADVVILLNSDVRLPARFFSRILTWAGHIQDAALMTVPSYGEIAHRIPSLDDATWQEADFQLASVADGMFMQACTAVGYCLIIDRRLVASPLLDDTFGHGYGEDSDLHYRVIVGGSRSLLYLGMCISHEGAASYSLVPEARTEFANGQKLFYARWGSRYARDFPAFHRSYSTFLRESLPVGFQSPSAGRVTFVLPAMDGWVGGQQVVVRAAKELASRQVPARVLSLNGDREILLDGLRSVEPRQFPSSSMTSADTVMLCGNSALEWWSDMGGGGDRPTVAFVLQGFDHLMDPRFTGAMEDILARADVVFSVSPFLDSLAVDMGARDVRGFTPGLGAAAFSPDLLPWSARELDVLVSLRMDHTKGWWIGATLANALVRRGLRVGVFGPYELTRLNLNASVVQMGRLSRGDLLRQFGATRVFVDPVLAEGYGMMPREAILRGAHAFIGEGGGNDAGRLSNHSTMFAQHYDVYRLVRQIIGRLESGSACRGEGPDCKICALEPDVEVDETRPPLERAILSWLADRTERTHAPA